MEGRWRLVLRRLARVLQPPRRLRLTREGWAFAGMALAVALAAMNTGNNLLYLVFSTMLSLFALSGILSEAAMARVKVERIVPGMVHAGEEASCLLILKNPRSFFSHLAISLEELPGKGADLVPARAFFPRVPARGEAASEVGLIFRRRGLHRLEEVEVSTTYPFGLARKSYRILLPAEVVVFPAREALRSSPTPLLAEGSLQARPRSIADGDPAGLREHLPEEDSRTIHWKASARRGRLLSVERSAEEGRTRWVVLAEEKGGDSPQAMAVFEGEVRRAAAEVREGIRRGERVGLRGPQGLAIPPGEGRHQEKALLTALALVPGGGR